MVHYKYVFFVLLVIAFLIPNRTTFANEEGTMITVKVDDYENAPFPHFSRKDGRPELGIGPEHFQSSKVAVFYPTDLTPDANGGIRIVLYVHSWEKDITNPDFLNLMQKSFSEASANLSHTIMVAPQFALSADDNSPGKLGEVGGLERLLLEVFRKNNFPWTIGDVIVIAYSGGYYSATKCLDNNDHLNFVGEVFLDGLLWYMEDASDRVSSLKHFLWLIYGQETLSQTAMKAMVALMNHAENKYVIHTEEAFADSNPGEEIQVVMTTKAHKEIPKMLGMILKKL